MYVCSLIMLWIFMGAPGCTLSIKRSGQRCMQGLETMSINQDFLLRSHHRRDDLLLAFAANILQWSFHESFLLVIAPFSLEHELEHRLAQPILETGGILFRECCFKIENSLSSAPNALSSAQHSMSSLWHTHTHIYMYICIRLRGTH